MPASDCNKTPEASFTFQVQDDSGTTDLDLSPNTLSVNFTAVNDAPSCTIQPVPRYTLFPYTTLFRSFGFSDVDGDTFQAAKITTLPAAGAGTLTNDGIAVVA